MVFYFYLCCLPTFLTEVEVVFEFYLYFYTEFIFLLDIPTLKVEIKFFNFTCMFLYTENLFWTYLVKVEYLVDYLHTFIVNRFYLLLLFYLYFYIQRFFPTYYVEKSVKAGLFSYLPTSFFIKE